MPGIELLNGAGSLAQPRRTHFSDPLPDHALASMNVTQNRPHVNMLFIYICMYLILAHLVLHKHSDSLG